MVWFCQPFDGLNGLQVNRSDTLPSLYLEDAATL